MRHCGDRLPINQNEFDALVSIAFNIGGGAFKLSTLVKRLNAGDRKAAADQFLVWNKITVNGKKQVLKGLTTRREAERKQFLTPVVAANPEAGIPATEASTSFWADFFNAIFAFFGKGK